MAAAIAIDVFNWSVEIMKQNIHILMLKTFFSRGDSLLLRIRTRYEFDLESVIEFSICEGVKETVECFMW